MQSLNEAGRTVILTTHHMDEAEVLCDRVAVMDHGRLLVNDRPAALVRDLDAPLRVLLAPGRLDLETARALPSVESASTDGHGLLLVTRTPSVLLARLAELNALDGLQVHGANLEDVFLNLTGREYRA